jgi:hypothetical protein
MKSKRNWNEELAFIGVVLLCLAVGSLGGFVLGYKQGAQYTYDSVFLLFTNGVNEAATSLDCYANSSEITIKKRKAPLNCCYPANCPQAEDNPTTCNCLYTIQCFGGIDYEK